MTLNEYQPLAARTMPDLGDEELNLAHMDMGIITEIGEMIDIFKRNLAYKKEIDLVNLGEECADICWYAVNKLAMLDEDIEDRDVDAVKLSPLEAFYVLNDYLKEEEDENLLIHFVKFIAVSFGLDFYELLDKNINKLRVRFPDKFNEDNALNRDLDAERDELSK